MKPALIFIKAKISFKFMWLRNVIHSYPQN